MILARNVRIDNYKECQVCSGKSPIIKTEDDKEEPLPIRRAMWVVPINRGHNLFYPDGSIRINNALFVCSKCFEDRNYNANRDNVGAITFGKPRLFC